MVEIRSIHASLGVWSEGVVDDGDWEKSILFVHDAHETPVGKRTSAILFWNCASLLGSLLSNKIYERIGLNDWGASFPRTRNFAQYVFTCFRLSLVFMAIVDCVCVSGYQEMRHPNVVKLLRVFNSPKHLFMAMEALEGRPLYREIRRLGRLHEDRSRNLFKQVSW